MTERKGVILAAGSGSRLYPATAGINKHLLPVWDRPLIYYPLVNLMLLGIREVLIVTGERDRRSFEGLLGQGARWGMRFSYETQSAHAGVAHALSLAEDWLDGSPCALTRGDSVFLGAPWLRMARELANSELAGANLLAARTADPRLHTVVRLNSQGEPVELEDQPRKPNSPWAVTGLALYDGRASAWARELVPSADGLTRLSDLDRLYLREGALRVIPLPPGVQWSACMTHADFNSASEFLRNQEADTGQRQIGPEEAALRLGWVDAAAWQRTIENLPDGSYRRHLELLPKQQRAA